MTESSSQPSNINEFGEDPEYQLICSTFSADRIDLYSDQEIESVWKTFPNSVCFDELLRHLFGANKLLRRLFGANKLLRRLFGATLSQYTLLSTLQQLSLP